MRNAELQGAVAAGIITGEQAERLAEFLSRNASPRFTFVNVLYYLGGMLAIGAMSLFIAALSLGREAPAWECSLGRFLFLAKSSPRGRLWQCAHPQPLSPLQGRLAPRSEGKARAELRHQSGTTHGSHTPAACS